MSTVLVEGLALGYFVMVYLRLTSYLRFCEHKLKCSCDPQTTLR